MFAFQRDGSKALRKTLLPWKIGRDLFHFEKDLQASQGDRERIYNYKFSQGNTLRKWEGGVYRGF